jgi:hypothetical protein
MFQVSDEVAYFAAVQHAGLAALPPGSQERTRIAPPDGEPAHPPWAKPAFGALAGPIHLGLARAFTPAAAAHLLRLIFSLSLLAAAYFTWRLARHLTPDNLLVVWGAPTLVALHPVFVSYGAAISPDSLSNAIGAASLAFLVEAASPGGRTRRLLLGSALALLAFLVKDTAFALIVVAVLAAGIRLGRGRATRRRLLMGTAVMLGVVAAGAAILVRSPYFQAVGDTAGARTAADVALRLATETYYQAPGLFHSFWANIGNFGGNEVLLPPGVVRGAALACLLAAIGLAVVLRRGAAWLTPAELSRVRQAAMLVAAGFLVALLQAPLREAFLGGHHVFQGRWLFPFMSPLMIALCLGLSWWLPRPERALPLLALLAASLAGVGLLWVVLPHYYTQFPNEYRLEGLFLRGTFGAPLDTTRLLPYLARPGPLGSVAFMAGLLLAFVASLGAWCALCCRAVTRPPPAAGQRAAACTDPVAPPAR